MEATRERWAREHVNIDATREWVVPVTIADERHVVVRAKTKEEAKRKVQDGRYLRLGRTITRGFLLVGTPEPK